MEISVLTDEIDPDIFKAMESATAWGIRRFEIRKIYGQRVPSIPGSMCKRVQDALLRYQASVTALSPGLFKKAESLLNNRRFGGGSWWEDADVYEEYRGRAYEILDRTIDLANGFNSSAVTIFSPEVPLDRTGGECPQRIVELIRDAAIRAARHGITLLLENDFGLWADTGKNAMRLAKSVDQDNLKVNWDPANAYVAGEVPFPEGYDHVKRLVGNVHAKDAIESTPAISEEYEVLGTGDIDWVGQIRALHEDGYAGSLCIETHSHPLREKTFRNVCFLRHHLNVLSEEARVKNDPRGQRHEEH